MKKNMLFPEPNERYVEGFVSPVDWVYSYLDFRKQTQKRQNAELLAQKALAVMGKNNSHLIDRYRGSLLGLAIGDAFGTTLEFSERPLSIVHTKITGGGPFQLRPGQWTDDTSMALCLAHSLVDRNSFDAASQMELYNEWRESGFLSSTGTCFDIGNTVRSALDKFRQTGEPFSGESGEYSAGNGSLMRLAPVVLFFASNPYKAIELAGKSSRTTHNNIKAVDSCRYFAALILGAVQGVSKQALLAEMYAPIKDYWNDFPLEESVEAVARGSFKSKNREQIESTGFVIHSMEAALWAFYNFDNFLDGMVAAVNLGGDSDTIGAIYGQLAGAYYGEMSIPVDFILPITKKHYFYFLADDFASRYNNRGDLIRLSVEVDEGR